MLDFLNALFRSLSPLWKMSVTAAYAAAVVIVLRLLLKKRAPRQVLCLLWLVVFARLLIPVSLESPLSIVPNALPGQEHTAPAGPADGDPVLPNAPQDTVQDQIQNQPGDGAAAPVTGQNPALSIPDGVSPAAPVPEAPAPPLWQAAAAGVWLTGAAALGGYALVSWLRLRRRLFDAIRAKDGAWEHPAVDSPFILGVLRPRIYLPAGLTGRPRRFILCHERAHLRRFDHIVKPVCWAALALHWFNPLAWAAFLLMSRDIEAACDEAVVRQLGSRVKADYSYTLLALATGPRLPAPCPLAFDEGDAKGRIRNVLNYRRPALWVIVISVIAAAAAAVCLLTDPVAAREPEGGPDPGAEASFAPNAAGSLAPGITGSPDPDASGSWNVEVLSSLPDPWMKEILDGERTFFRDLYYYHNGIQDDRVYSINDLFSFFYGAPEFNFPVMPGKLAIVDLDRDGIKELVIHPVNSPGLMDSIIYNTGYLILRRVGDEVYGYAPGWRSCEYLKADGTFGWSSGAGNWGTASLSFNGNQLVHNNITWCTNNDDPGVVLFFVDGRKATQEEFDAAVSAHDAKPEPIWYTYENGVLTISEGGDPDLDRASLPPSAPSGGGTQTDRSVFTVQAGDSSYQISFQLDLPGEIHVTGRDFISTSHEYWDGAPKGKMDWTDKLPEGAQELSDGTCVRSGLGFYDGSLDVQVVPAGVTYREWYYPIADGALYLCFRWDETDLETAEAVRATLRYSAETLYDPGSNSMETAPAGNIIPPG